MKYLVLIFLIFFTWIEVLAQSWQSLNDIPVPLSFPVVVVLNGEIHVIGGGATGGATDIHLRFKPATNTWDTLAPVPYKAQQPAGAVLNGKIYFCGGGFPNSGTPLKKNYYFDPDSNKWYQGADMPVATVIHKAVAFDNRIYVLGGQPNKTLCEYYDPALNSWTQRNPLPDQNFWYGAIVADKKSIYRFGGGGYSVPQKTTHQYDKTNDTWLPMTDLPLALHGADAAMPNDSTIYITGGYNVGDKDRVWKFNINQLTYVSTGVMPAARSYHSMVTVDSCIYAVGGNNNSVPSVNVSILKYCPQANEAGIIEHKGSSKPYSISYREGTIGILFDENSNNRDRKIDLIDLTGRSCFYTENASDPVVIYNDRLKPSIYSLRITVAGINYSERIIITQ